MGVTLFTDRRMLDHRPPARHPERPERLQAVLRHLERIGFMAKKSRRDGVRSDCRRIGQGSRAGISATNRRA